MEAPFTKRIVMNKFELAKCLAEKLSVTQKLSTDFLNAMQEIVADELSRDEKVLLKGFGSFTSWKQTERSGRNPRNGTPHMIEPRTSVKFKPGKELLKRLNEKNKKK